MRLPTTIAILITAPVTTPLALSTLAHSTAHAGDTARVSFEQPAPTTTSEPNPEVPTTEQLESVSRLSYMQQDFKSLAVGAAVAWNLEDDPATDTIGYVAYQHFLSDEFELIGELGILHSNQIGDNATGFNPVLAFRYHYWHNASWSLFVDAGIGFLFSTDDIPDMGTPFNFTPRAGLGFTRKLTGSDIRLISGLRWHHISNARIDGDTSNPDRDGILIYAGISFPL